MEALRIDPDYVLAKRIMDNLRGMKEKLEEGSSQPTATKTEADVVS